MAKYTLVGVNGNAYSVMGYTARALKQEGLGHLTGEMTKKQRVEIIIIFFVYVWIM